MPGSRRSRSVAIRSPLPVVVVVCDDSKTSPAYFSEVKRVVRKYVHLDIVPACKDTMDRAIQKRKELKSDGGETEGDAVWILIDCERDEASAQLKKSRGQREGIRVALSKPCFELWTLLHLKDIGQAFNHCDHVIDMLKPAWKAKFREEFPQKKANADYSKIIPMRGHAIIAAKRHCDADDPSWTEVHELVAAIDSIVERRRAAESNPEC